MAPQPQGAGFIGDVSDDELDAAVNSAFDSDDETPAPTEAPDPAPSVPSSDDNTEAPETDNASAGDATPAPASAAQPAPDAASQPAATDEGKPFQFKASGRDEALPWARERADGSVVIPKDSANEFRRVLASQRELETNFTKAKRQFDRELNQARTTRTQKDAEADAYIAWGASIAQKTPQEVYDYFSQLQGNVPLYQIELEKKKLDEQRKLIEQQQRGPQLSPEEQQEQTAELASHDLRSHWEQIQNHADLSALTPQEKQQVYERWAKKPGRLVRTIQTEAEAQQYGGKIGDQLFDPTEMHDDLRFLIGLKQQGKPANGAPSAAAQANATRNADKAAPVNRIPPTVRSTPPVGQARARNGQFKAAAGEGRRKFKDYLMSDEDEDE